jgi:WD40 repeat protein
MIAELSLLAVGGSDSQIKLFYLNNDAKGLTLELKSSLKKESGHRVQQLYFDRKRQTLLVLSADNKVEAWSVNTDNTEAVLKKLTRQTKKSLKRTYSEAQEGSVEVDKSELLRKIEARDYDMALHFAKNASVHTLDTVHKAKCFQVLPSKEFEIIVAYHNNRLYHYSITEEASKQLGVIGELHTHETPIRGVTLSPDDSLFATFSFDCLKVWSVDLYASNKSGLL